MYSNDLLSAAGELAPLWFHTPPAVAASEREWCCPRHPTLICIAVETSVTLDASGCRGVAKSSSLRFRQASQTWQFGDESQRLRWAASLPWSLHLLDVCLPRWQIATRRRRRRVRRRSCRRFGITNECCLHNSASRVGWDARQRTVFPAEKRADWTEGAADRWTNEEVEMRNENSCCCCCGCCGWVEDRQAGRHSDGCGIGCQFSHQLKGNRVSEQWTAHSRIDTCPTAAWGPGFTPRLLLSNTQTFGCLEKKVVWFEKKKSLVFAHFFF